MGSRFARFRGITRRLFGHGAAEARPSAKPRTVPQFVQLEDRSVPATFVVTNILDSVTDQGGGLSLRQAILAANNNPGHDDIVFNIPISPSLPTLPNDPTVQYFPIILATTLPDLTDPQGVTIDATTQPRVDVASTRPLVQLLPNPNKGAFPNEIGAYNITGQNNVIRGFVITGFPGSAINLVGVNAKNNMVLGNWINTDITGLLSWNKDPIILQARPPGTPDELTNAGPVPNSGDAKHVISGITLIGGASDNIIGGTTDAAGVPLVDGGGRLIGAGGTIIRFNNANPPGGIPITMDINRNVISGTPEYRKDFILAPDGGTRERDLTGAAVGPGIRIMDPGTSGNLVQGNFIGTDVTGEKAIPNQNGIEILNGAFSNTIGNPLTPDSANVIRFNVHDGVRIAETPNPSKLPPRPPIPLPRGEDDDFFAPVFYDHYSPNYFIGGVAGGGISIVDLGATAPRRDTANAFGKLAGIDPDDYGAAPTTVRGAEVQVGTTLTLRGRNLLGTTAVSFFATEDGVSLVQGKFQIIDDATVRVTVPEGAVTGTIQVSSAGGVFPPSGTTPVGLRVVVLPTPQPILENTSTFTPSSGTTGQLVTVSGKNFGGTLQVLFNGQPASKFSVLDVGTANERIEAFVPQDATTGPITIQNPAGADVTVRDFVVVTEPPPSIDNLLTTSGVPGQEIILSGSGFTSMTLVRFGVVNGSSGFATADFVIDSPTQVRVRVPANATPVLGQIQVATAGGTALSPQSFQILPAAIPSVTALSTSNAVVGTTITITGTNLQSTLQVLVGGVASPRVRVLDNNTITAVIPPLSQGAYQLVVQSLGGSATPQGFTVAPSPFPTVDPINGVFRNSQVIITGTGLLGTSKILFGDPRDGFGVRVTQFEVLSNTQIRMTIPVGASSGPFFVTTPGGQATNAATILASGVPNISEAALPNPVSGIVGSVVELQGNGLLGTQDVFFPAVAGGTIPAASFTVVGDTLITAVVPVGAKTGGIQVQVPSRLPGGARQTVTSAPFTVLASQGPILNLISTTSGPIGTFVTLTGSGFTGAQQVVVGGIPQTDFTILSDNQIQFRVPNLAQDGSVAVVTPAGVGTNGLTLAGILPTPGTLVTVTGTGFSGATAVTIGGVAVGSLNIVADTRITFLMPAGAANGTIVVTKPSGSPAAMGTMYDVTPSAFPQITFSSPGTVRNAQVTIQGAALSGTTQVLFNDIPAEFTVVSDAQLNAIVPDAAAPGTIKVVTPGGFAISPNDFRITSAAPPQLFDIKGIGPAVTSPDIGIIGSQFFLNGSDLGSIFRVEMTPVDVQGNVIGAATEAKLRESDLSFTIPAVAPGLYSVEVYASTKTLATAAVGVVNDFGSNGDTTIRTAVNILGQEFRYGDVIEVIQNAQPVIDRVVSKAKDPDVGVTNDEDRLLRGVPISIFGSGFTGASQVSIGGLTLDAVDGEFFVISDEEISTNIPNTGGLFGGVTAITGAKVGVSVPTFTTLGSKTFQSTLDTQEDVRIDIAATPPLIFSAPDGGARLPGTEITLTAAAGSTFYGVRNIRFSGTAIDANKAVVSLGADDAPFFREAGAPPPFVNFDFPNLSNIVEGNGKTIRVQIGTGLGKIPDPPTGAAKVGFLTVTAFNNETAFGIAGTGTPTIIPNEVPNIAGIQGSTYNRTIILQAPAPGSKDRASLISVDAVVFTTETPVGPGTITVGRNNIRVVSDGISLVNLEVELPTGTLFPLPAGTLGTHTGTDTFSWPTGAVKAVSADGNGTATFTRTDQPIPVLFEFLPTPRAPQDNRILAQPIFENGKQTNGGIGVGLIDDLATQLVDGNAGIDFVTRTPFNVAPTATDLLSRTFRFGYDRQELGGNHSRGGPNDGFLNSFALNPGDPNGNGAINTFNNVVGGRFYGPNLLQNFPLLQVVQSSLDRSSFNTALIAKPFRSYRIDYYYNPGFNDTDPTALQTSVAGYGELFLGSKIINTDFQGNGSILFSVGVKQPDANGDVIFAPGEFRLPNNMPLPDQVANPGAGVVVATATDLTAPGEFGPTVNNGPDGTSRYSFFRRVDASTGAISGQVIFDKNGNGKQDSNEGGVGAATVELFLRQVDGSLPNKANVTLTTDDGGAFTFDQSSTLAGLGLPNGTHQIRVTLPTGKDFVFSVPANGILNPTIVAGETVTGVNFLVTGTGAAIPTGKIGGTIVHDQDADGIVDAGEPGIAGATVGLFLRQPDGTFAATPIQTFTTAGTGTYLFGAPPAGTPLAIGTYQLRLTLPNGKDFQFGTPSNGIITQAIAMGETVTGVNFLAVGTGNTVPPVPPPPLPPPPPPPPPPPIPPIVPGQSILAVGADTGGGPTVGVYDQLGTFLYQFNAYDPRFTGGVRVATGDVTGDGKADVVTAPGIGIPGLVKVFDGTTGLQISQFQPYEDAFTGGVYVALGDIDGDGKDDIVTGTGFGGGPRVQVFRGGSFDSIVNFFPYEDSFRGGVLVAAGDVNGDGRADIVTGTGIGGGPRVQVFSGADFSVLFNFFAYESSFRGGVFASVGDLTGDGKAEVLTGTGVGGGPVVKAFTQAALAAPNPIATQSFFAFDPGFRGGVRVDSIDGNNDGRLDYIVSAGPGENPLVRVIDFANLQDIYRIQAFDPSFLGGVFVGGTH